MRLSIGLGANLQDGHAQANKQNTGAEAALNCAKGTRQSTKRLRAITKALLTDNGPTTKGGVISQQGMLPAGECVLLGSRKRLKWVFTRQTRPLAAAEVPKWPTGATLRTVSPHTDV